MARRSETMVAQGGEVEILGRLTLLASKFRRFQVGVLRQQVFFLWTETFHCA